MAGASGGNFGDFNSMFSGMSPGAYTASSGPITSASTYDTASTTTTPTTTGFNGGGPGGGQGIAGTAGPTGGMPGTNIMGTPTWLNDYAASGATDMNSWFQQNVAGYGSEAPGMTPEQVAAGGVPANAAPLPADREAYRHQMDTARSQRMPVGRLTRAPHYNPAAAARAAAQADPWGRGGGMGGGGMGMGGGLGPGAGPFRWQQGPPKLNGGRRR